MGKGDNGLLVALAILESIEPQLKVEKRDQLSRANLNAINISLTQALNFINKAGISDAYIIGNLIDVTECVNTLLADSKYVETDTETKEIIANKVMFCLENLYVEVGKYYLDRDFEYSIKLDPLLTRVVDRCIEKGFYFGVEVGPRVS